MRGPNAVFSPDKLAEMSSLVFEGIVRDVETNEKYMVSFPTKARVTKVLKGSLSDREITFFHKTPEKNVILEAEFNIPGIGDAGTFYLQKHSEILYLIGYIKKAEQGH